MTDYLTTLCNDDGPIDEARIARILQLEAENAALREAGARLADMYEQMMSWDRRGPEPLPEVDAFRALLAQNAPTTR